MASLWVSFLVSVLSKIPLINLVYSDAERNCLLKDAEEKMLEKGALLSGLNTHLHIPSFKMETAKIIQESLDQGQWMTSIDLPDA